jgi:DNA-binding response OmpR family regulator
MSEQDLAGRRLLVVEDCHVIAEEIACLLKTHGSIVLGPASTVEQGLRILWRWRPDGVLLDVKLGNETSEALAATARQCGIPMLLLTGVERRAIPAALVNEPYLAKPFQAAELVAAAASLLARPASGSIYPVEQAPRLYSAQDLARARRQVEKAARLVAEQRVLTARLSAKGLETKQAKSLLRLMRGLLKQMERQRNTVAGSLLPDEEDSAPAH